MYWSSFVTFKDIFYLIAGIAIGLIAGVGIYWWPLGQFQNEWKALWNLIRNRYARGDSVRVKIGTDLKRVGMSEYPRFVTQDHKMKIWHDEGVDWFHSSTGWKRARVLQVFDSTDSENASTSIYRVSHLDLLKSLVK